MLFICSLNLEKKFISFVTSAPRFDQISEYDIKGRLLIFPIFGNGKAVLTQSKYYFNNSAVNITDLLIFKQIEFHSHG